MLTDRFTLRCLEVVGINLTTTAIRPNRTYYKHLQSVLAQVAGRRPPRTTAWVKREWERMRESFSEAIALGGSHRDIILYSLLPLVYRRRFSDSFAPSIFEALRVATEQLSFTPEHYTIDDSIRRMLDQLCAQKSFRLVAMTYAGEADVRLMLEAWPELSGWFERIYVLRTRGPEAAVVPPDVIVPCGVWSHGHGLTDEEKIDRMFKHLGVTRRQYLHVGSHWLTDVLFASWAGVDCLLLDHEQRYLGPKGGWRMRGKKFQQGHLDSGHLVVVRDPSAASSIILNTARAATKRT